MGFLIVHAANIVNIRDLQVKLLRLIINYIQWNPKVWKL